MNRFFPLVARMRGRLGLPNDVIACHARRWVIDPGCEVTLPPSTYVEDDLARITAASENDTVADVIAYACTTSGHHAPTVAYELHNAVLSGAHLFTARVAHRLDTRPFPLIARKARHHMREAVLVSSHYGIRYFGHWMTDDTTLVLAAKEFGSPVSALLRPTRHQSQYLEILDWNVPVNEDVVFDKITVLQDYGQNKHKARRYGAFRQRMGARLALSKGNPGVMLLRGNSGQRRILVNESAVADALRARGFAVLDPEATSVEELARACFHANIIIGVEGSQLAHGISVMSPRGTLVELQPPSRFNALFRGRCACEGIGYAFQVGHQQADGDDFSIDVPAMNRLLDSLPTQKNPLTHTKENE